MRVTAKDFKRAVDDTGSERKERRKEMEGQKTNSRRRCGSSLGTALGRCHCPLRSWHMSSIFRFRVLGYSATLEKAWRGVKWSQSQFHSSTPHSQPTTKRIFPFVWSSLMIWPCCRTCRSFRCPMLPETMCHRPVLYVRTLLTVQC